MTTSVLSRTAPPAPLTKPPTKPVFRSELAVIHSLLAELEGVAPPGYPAALADITEFLEDLLAELGWKPPPLTRHDKEVLAALGCPE